VSWIDGLTIGVDGAVTINENEVSIDPAFTVNSGGSIAKIQLKSTRSSDGQSNAILDFYGHDDGGNDTIYGQIFSTIVDNTDGIEDGRVSLRPMINGSLSTMLEIEGNAITSYTDFVVPSTTNPLIHIERTGSGYTSVTQGHGGLLLTANGMNTTSQYTPALMFGSTDANFTTSNPKFLAGIWGEARQTYNDDNDGSMALRFGITGTNPGATPSPVVSFELSQDENVRVLEGDLMMGNISRTHHASYKHMHFGYSGFLGRNVSRGDLYLLSNLYLNDSGDG
jgi:hypothetical protein